MNTPFVEIVVFAIGVVVGWITIIATFACMAAWERKVDEEISNRTRLSTIESRINDLMAAEQRRAAEVEE